MSERTEWLEKRRLGIGGSDVAGILNLSPWATPFSIWQSKVLPVEEQFDEDDKAKRRGRLLEHAVGEWAAEELERTLTPTGLIIHPEHDWARATPDYFLDKDIIPGVGCLREGLEVKTTRERWDRLPAHVELQCLHYLNVAELDVWHVAVFSTLSEDWTLFKVTRAGNEDVLERMMIRLGAWWNFHVVLGNAPDLDTSRAAAQYLNRQHRDHSDRFRFAEQDDRNLITMWQQAKRMERDAKAVREMCEVQLKARIGDDKGLIGDFGRLAWSRWTEERLDLAGVREKLPLVLDSLKAGGFIRKSERGRLNYTPKKERK